MKQKVNAEMCSACGGDCCKYYAGFVSPHDIAEPFEQNLAAMLASDYCIDPWEGDLDGPGELSQILMVRPRHTNAPDELFDSSWGGVCSMLTDKGCKLSYENRPKVCRELVPNYEFRSKQHKCVGMSKHDSAKEWRPFQDKVKAALAKMGVLIEV